MRRTLSVDRPPEFATIRAIMDKLKIALTHTRYSYTGGIEKYIHSLVERLLAAGHEVHYIAAKWEPREHPRLIFHRVPIVRFPPSLRVLSFNDGANRILDEHDFDIVHGFTKTDRQDVYTDGSGCLEEYLDATLADRPRWWRRLYRATPHQRAIEKMERRRFQRNAIRHIVPMARFVRDQILLHYPVEPERVEVVYNGVELEHFNPRNRETLGVEYRRAQKIDPDTPLLLFVGNDWKRKGLVTVLEALPKIAEAIGRPPLLLVAGHDNHPDRFESTAARLGVTEMVRWLGPVREIREPFAAADLFVFPTRYDVFGNVGLEALASGVPSLLSRRAGVSEVIEGHEGAAGKILHDPYSSEELAAGAIELLQGDSAETRAAARSVAEEYSWDRHFDRILEIYDQVLAEKRAEKEHA